MNDAFRIFAGLDPKLILFIFGVFLSVIGSKGKFILEVLRRLGRSKRKEGPAPVPDPTKSDFVLLCFGCAAMAVALFGFFLGFLRAPTTNGPTGLSPTLTPVNIPVGSQIATFSHGTPINNYGQQFDFLHDRDLCKVSYEIKKASRNDAPYFLAVSFHLPRANPHEEEPYCGVITQFAGRSFSFVDLSSFQGIEFDAQYHADTGPQPLFYARLYQPGRGQWQDDLNEAEFQAAGGFKHIHKSFLDFKGSGQLNLKEIFRIAFVIRGHDTSGRLDLTNIQLWRDQ